MIYKHDGTKFKVKIVELDINDNWNSLGISYICIYKNLINKFIK